MNHATNQGTEAQNDARAVLSQAIWSSQDCGSGSVADHVGPAYEQLTGSIERLEACRAELARLGFTF